MTIDPIVNAANRLAAIKEEIATLQVEAREIENALNVMRRFVEAPAAKATEQQPLALPIPEDVGRHIEATARHAVSQGFQMSQAEFEVIASRALEQERRPLTRTQLLRWMEENGTPVTGIDASKNAGTKLWRARDRFVNIRGAGYWFKGRPCPAVGYDPKSAEGIVDGEFPMPPDDIDTEEAA
ncbi:MAG TPA: hypothetical protein VND87_05575 [Stellaceae bacterium]|nr:hypothetical protein [Stellaceae bacterium]